MERMEASRDGAREVYEVGVRIGWKDNGVHGERGKKEREVENKDEEEEYEGFD